MRACLLVSVLVGVCLALPAFRGNWRARHRPAQIARADLQTVEERKNKLLSDTLLKRAQGADCEDTGKAEDCTWWNEQGYCTDDKYKVQMNEQCAATCGCVEVEAVAVVKRQDCKNKGSDEDCDWWNKQGYCTDDTYKGSMLDQCPCTCEEGGEEPAAALKKRESGESDTRV